MMCGDGSYSKSKGPIKRHTRICLAVTGIIGFVGFVLLIVTLVNGRMDLNEDEQVLISGRSSKRVENGPGQIFFNAFRNSAEKRSAILLSEFEYVHTKNTLTGEERAVAGPDLHFLGAYEAAGERKLKVVLSRTEYLKVLDITTGEDHIVKGPAVFTPSPTDRIEEDAGVISIRPAFKLLRHQYLKLVDLATGQIRVLVGEQLVFPGPMEAVEQDVSDAVNVDQDTAVLVLSKLTGQQRLVTDQGIFVPGAYEEIVEVRKLIRVEPHEVVAVQDTRGTYTFYNGSTGGIGTAFFLPPHHELVTMHWSSDSSPGELEPMTIIDLRAQHLVFHYTVRTQDNVELNLEGTIFWQVTDVPKMIERTADPRGDVWYKARSTLMQAVSTADLEEFMQGFNELVASAATREAGFYEERGVKLHTLEVTSFACKDAVQEKVLQDIIRETTNRINRLQQQRSENDVEKERLRSDLDLAISRRDLVRAEADNELIIALAQQRKNAEVESEKLTADIALELARKDLVDAKTLNENTLAEAAGGAQGMRFATSMSRFLDELDQSVPNADERLALFKYLATQEATTQQIESTTANLGGGSANLFLTPADLNLRFGIGDSIAINSDR